MTVCSACGGEWVPTTLRGFRRCSNWPSCDSILWGGQGPTDTMGISRAHRARRLIVDGTALLHILRGDSLALTGMPADARLSFSYDSERAALVCYIESADFEPVPPGEVIPEFGIQHAQIFPSDFVGDREAVVRAAREKVREIAKPTAEPVKA